MIQYSLFPPAGLDEYVMVVVKALVYLLAES